jgi:hypothetical protein
MSWLHDVKTPHGGDKYSQVGQIKKLVQHAAAALALPDLLKP